MKATFKKSILLLGVATGFLLTAWAQENKENDPAWYVKGELEPWCSGNGDFVLMADEPHRSYGYCRCYDGFVGQRCEYDITAPIEE